MKNLILYGLTTLLWFAATSVAPATGQVEQRARSFSVGKGGSLDVALSSGEVVITAWDRDEVFVKVEGIRDKDLRYVSMEQSGDTVTVKYRPKGGWFSSSGRFDITVPMEFNVNIKTAGGSVEVSGILKGVVKGSTSGGDIRLKQLGGRVEMTTAGGDIRSDDIRGDAYLKTSGGDIRVGDIAGDAELATAGGDIRVRNVGKALKARTAGGDIVVQDVGGDVAITTAGGDIRAGSVSGSASLTTAGGDLVLGSARGEVTAKTAGGDIQLTNLSGSVEAKTAGGAIHVELVPDEKGKSNLVTAAGDVRFFIPASARATIEARIHIEGNWKRLSGNFDIRSDFPPQEYVKNDMKREIRATYVLNGGGHPIVLRTVNSNIEVRALKK